MTFLENLLKNNKLVEYITMERSNFEWIGFIVDIFCVLVALCLVFAFIGRNFKLSFLIKSLITFIVLGTVSILLNLVFLPIILALIVVFFMIISIVYFSSKLGYFLKSSTNNNNKQGDKSANLISAIIKTISNHSAEKVGTLIAIERNSSLKKYTERAIMIDSEVSFELLKTIFYVGTPLHDGGVIISNNRVVCASTYFPLTMSMGLPKKYGTRHQAAIGLSEEVKDALVIVVSEESGSISFVMNGLITSDITIDQLREILIQNLGKNETEKSKDENKNEDKINEGKE